MAYAAHVIGTIWSSFLTAGMMVAALAFAFAVVTHRWRALASSYAARGSGPAESELRDWAIIATAHRYRDLTLPATFTVHRDGLSIRTVSPLSWALAPMFLPFDRMELVPTSYGFDREAWMLRMAGHSDIQIIVARQLKPWLLPQLPLQIRANPPILKA